MPLEDSFGAMVQVRNEDKVEWIGVSNLDAAELAVAQQKVGDVACLQNPLAVNRLEHLELAETCPVPFHVWAPLQGARTDHECRQIPAFSAVAGRLCVTVRQVVLAWLRSIGPDVTPIIGPVNVVELAESLSAPDHLRPTS